MDVVQAAPLVESLIFMYVGWTGMLHVKCPSKNRVMGWMKLEESLLASFHCNCKRRFLSHDLHASVVQNKVAGVILNM